MIETNELKGKISSDNKIQGGNTVISGPQGKEGLSAYEVAVKNGYIGSEEEWLKTLKGEKGDQGEQGIQGDVSLKQLNELQTKTIKCLQEVETPTPVSGTSIDLNDSAEAKITDLKISGNSKQETRSGKNKLNFSEITTQTINGLTITNNKDGSITLNGTTTATVSMDISDRMYNLVAGNYYLSRNSSGTVSGTFTNILYGKNETAVNIGGLTSEGMTITATTDYQEYYLWLYVASGITFTNYTMKPQLEAGTVKTDWELYGAMPSPKYPSEVECCGDNGSINEVICNKNLFDKKKILTGYYLDKSGNVIQNDTWNYSDYIKVLPNTIFIVSADNDIGNSPAICFYDKNKKFISGSNYGNGVVKKYTTPSNCYYIRLSVSNPLLNSFQLEEGSTATPYEEHKSQTYTIPVQQPMRSVGDIRDTFIKKNNKWYERHWIARKIFDGNENLVYTANTGNRYAYNIALNGKIKGQHSKEYLSNMYKQKSEGSWSSDGIISVSETSYNTYIFITGLSTTSDVKAWLKELYDAGTPLYIDYILETPLDIECTEEQSTILFDIEQNAKTYDKVTHMYSTDEVSSYKEVTYKKDIETLFENTLVS